MLEVTDATAAAATETTSQTGPSGPVSVSEDRKEATLLGGGVEADEGTDDAPPEPAWRDDWRERLVEKLPQAERDKELKRLARFASPENVYKSLRSLETKVSAGTLKNGLPENPTEDEVAAFRKANGIPDEPDGYGLAFPDGLTPSDTDKADLAEFVKAMHAQNAPPGLVKAAFDQYVAMQTKWAVERAAQAQDETINRRAELRVEYGPEFKRNVGLADRFIAEHTGDQGDGLVGLRLADGTLLGDHPAFVRFAVNAALATSDDDTLIASPNAGGKADAARYKELLSLQTTDFSKYYSQPVQDEINAILKRNEKHPERLAIDF